MERVEWKAGDETLNVKVKAKKGQDISLYNANDMLQPNGMLQLLDRNTKLKEDEWKPRFRDLSVVPCRVKAVNNSNGRTAEKDVRNAPADCDQGGSPPPPNQPPVCGIDSPAGPVSIQTGGSVNYAATVSDSDGSIDSISWTFEGGTPSSASAEDPGAVTYNTAGTFTATLTASDSQGSSCEASVGITVVDDQTQLPDPVSLVDNTGLLGTDYPGYVVVAANDLGMHCADQDDRIFSVLPPFNVLHAQVIERGTGGGAPRILSGAEVSVVYSAASSPLDPVGPDSINSTSANFPLGGTGTPLVFKGNFWDADPDYPLAGTNNPVGFNVYSPLFFGLLSAGAVQLDLGLPAPETSALTACLPPPFGIGDGSQCHFAQQAMSGISAPYSANAPQPMHFDADFGFFNDLLGGLNGVNGKPLGSVVTGVNWFRADGIPILPVDDLGRANAYPLTRVQALMGAAAVASTDVVLPVAAEADCQGCHLDPNQLCTGLGLTCDGIAASFAGTSFTEVDLDDAAELASTPGDTDEQKVLNAAKINILRLHDAKHSTVLDSRRRVVCASCHYSPALDLAQVGPQDTPDGTAGTGLAGTEQTQHISMSRAMHGHHGEQLALNGERLFPDMPPPGQRTLSEAQQVLEETCYQCHPGKRTKCLRGAMGGSGIVCQDCHGSMTQVGNDFTADFPQGIADFTKRVSWASEPKCQSCHTGDALQPDHPAGAVVAPDGIRLLQAYTDTEHASMGGDATPIVRSNSRFAENETLFRLSGNDDGSGKGHGGIMCEGCHGSTHAIWPNAVPNANDNVAAKQLQGHAGALIECTTCHEAGSLPGTLDGPHGMHPVNDPGFIKGGSNWHGDMAKRENKNPATDACAACHGKDHQGTVLSRTPIAREMRDSEGKLHTTLGARDSVGCGHCHSLDKSFGD